MNRDTQTKRAFDKAKALHKKRLALVIYGRDYYTHTLISTQKAKFTAVVPFVRQKPM